MKMENSIESYISQVRTLIEESEPEFNLHNDLQAIKEKFNEEIEKCDKNLLTGCLSPSRLAIQKVKERINKLAMSKVESCMNEINQHINWAVEQRNQIEQNTCKLLVNDFLLKVDCFFEQELLNKKLNSSESRRQSTERQIVDAFQQELKKNIDPIKSAFRKEAKSFIDDLRSLDDNFRPKIQALLKRTKIFEPDLGNESNAQSTRLLFPSIFDRINKLTDNLMASEKELNNQIKANLEQNLASNLSTIGDRCNELKDDYLASIQTEQRSEFDKEIILYEDSLKKQVKRLLNDLATDSETSKETGNKSMFDFNHLAAKIMCSKIDSDLEQAWFKLNNQIKNYDLINELSFEVDYLDLRFELDNHIKQIRKQALKYHQQTDTK